MVAGGKVATGCRTGTPLTRVPGSPGWLDSRTRCSLFGALEAAPRGLAYLGYVSGVLLVLIYLGRLIILSASNPLVLGPAAIEGFIVNPAWYIWLGLALRRPATL